MLKSPRGLPCARVPGGFSPVLRACALTFTLLASSAALHAAGPDEKAVRSGWASAPPWNSGSDRFNQVRIAFDLPLAKADSHPMARLSLDAASFRSFRFVLEPVGEIETPTLLLLQLDSLSIGSFLESNELTSSEAFVIPIPPSVASLLLPESQRGLSRALSLALASLLPLGLLGYCRRGRWAAWISHSHPRSSSPTPETWLRRLSPKPFRDRRHRREKVRMPMMCLR